MNPAIPQPEPSHPIQLPIELKTPDSDLVLMRLHSETDPDSLISRFNMEKIPASENFSQVIGTIPQVASAIALNQSFRIVMPPGIVGHLMPLVKNPAMRGLLTTSIIGNVSGSSIIGTAGLASMASFALPLMIWTVLSFLTGQFFLAEIRRNTQAIFDELRNILYFLVAKEESDLGARIEFLQYLSINFNALSGNPEMRLSTLMNLQKVTLESLASLKLWVLNTEKGLEDITTTIDLVKGNKDRKANTDKLISLVGEARQNINRAIASYQCYSLGSILEIQLGSVFDPSLLNYTKKSLSEQSSRLKSALVKASNIWHDFKNISHFSESPKFKAGEIHAVGGELTGFSKQIDDSIAASDRYISAIAALENKGTSLLYYNNAFYRPSQSALSSN